ncbi:MAG: OmpA family protein [Dysgonomonas sp.]
MNKKFLFITCLTLAMAFNLSAQTQEVPEKSNKANAYKTTWEKNRFKDNWFISFGSGAQIIRGEDDDKGSFSKALTYAPSLTIGKYFSPIWGLRLNLTGGSLHGYNDGRSGYYRKWNYRDGNQYVKQSTWDPQWTAMGWGTPDNIINQDIVFNNNNNGEYEWTPGRNGKLYMQHVRYAAANVDFMFDFLTLIGDYDPKRTFDVTPFAGVSLFHVFPHMENYFYNGFGANAGIQAKFRINDKLKLFVEGTFTAYPDDFDGQGGDNVTNDFVAQAVGGLTLNIGKSTWSVCEPTNYQYIKDLNNQINDLQQQLQDLKNTPVQCPPCPPPPTEKVKEENKQVNFLPDPVFFRIDKSIIDANEWAKIDKAANYLNRHPEANVVVTGYADKQTAYPSYNLKLSERRSKTVAKALIEKYGINPLRVSINWEGDKIQPFSINDWNRVVIFVLE